MIGTVEGYLVGLSLVITLGYPLEFTNPVYYMPCTLMVVSPGLWFVSEAFQCWCSCRCLMDCRKATYWGRYFSISTYGSLITYIMNSVKYFQLLELINLALSPNWLIPTSGGRWRVAELASYGSIPFILGMYEDSIYYIFKNHMLKKTAKNSIRQGLEFENT